MRPAAAYYDAKRSEYLLPYEAVRTAPLPRAALLDFLGSTYEAGATIGGWDRAARALSQPSRGKNARVAASIAARSTEGNPGDERHVACARRSDVDPLHALEAYPQARHALPL